MEINVSVVVALVRIVSCLDEQIIKDTESGKENSKLIERLKAEKKEIEAKLTKSGYRVATKADFICGARLFCRKEGFCKVITNSFPNGLWETNCKNTFILESEAQHYLVRGK